MVAKKNVDISASGLIVGRFELLQVLGERRGLTFLAKDVTSAGRQVVIRFLGISHSVDDAGKLSMYLRRVAELPEPAPGVLAYLDSGPVAIRELGDRHFVARWFAPEHLARRLRETKGSSTLSVLAIAHDVAVGLSTLHGHGIVHGDLRPSNILLPSPGSNWVLADFGLAGLQSRDDVAFRAPECRWGDASSPVDVYAFGALLGLLLDRADSGGSQDWSLVRSVRDACLHDRADMRPDPQSIVLALSSGVPNLLERLQRELSTDEWMSQVRAILAFTLVTREIQASQRSQENAVRRAVKAFLQEVEAHHSLALRFSDPQRAIEHIANVALLDILGRASYAEIIQRGAEETSTLAPLDTPLQLDDDWLGLVHRIMKTRVEAAREIEADVAAPAEVIESLTLEPGEIIDEYDRELRRAAVARADLVREPSLPLPEILRRLELPDGVQSNEFESLVELGLVICIDVAGERSVPAFQIDWTTGSPYQAALEVNHVLRAGDDPWGALAWWVAPNSHLGGRRPADVVPAANARRKLSRAARAASHRAA